MRKILSDCDGVLLDWNTAFEKWMKFHFEQVVQNRTEYNIVHRYPESDLTQYLYTHHSLYLPRLFCNSSRIGSLKPLRDSVLYTRKLYEEFGITIDVVTSHSTDPESVRLRHENLKRHFGDAIDRIITLDTGAPKDEALKEWEGTGLIWVEDVPQNAVLGAELGLTTWLMDQEYNTDFKPENNLNIRRAYWWKDIYDYVKEQIHGS